MKKIRHNFNKGIKLHLACENYLIRPVMNCIYFKDGYAIASNGKILIKACLNEICNFSEEEKELLEGKLISAKNFKEIIKHTIIEIEEDGFHAIYDDWDIKYKFVTVDMKYPNYNEVISQFKPGFAEKVLIDPPFILNSHCTDWIPKLSVTDALITIGHLIWGVLEIAK